MADGALEPMELSAEEVQERVAALRGIGVFADLPEEQLQWFAGQTIDRRFVPGEVVFRRGDAPEWMVVYLEGELHSRRDDNLDGAVYIARADDPATQVSGMLPFSRMTEYPATGRAVLPTRLLLFPVRLFPEMLQRMPVLAKRLVGVMSDRVRESTRSDQQRDKLMALGKLSAGLAHELNNPAAAARRSADELLATLEKLRAVDLRLCQHQLAPAQRAFLSKFENEMITNSAEAEPLGALERSDREDELGEWLGAHGLADGWRMAPDLVEANLSAAQLERVLEEIGREALGDVLSRIAAQFAAANLVTDIRASTARISELVGAIKEYSYMDQAPMQEVDLHKGLENTLLILKHKLRKKNIEVVRNYAPDLPRMMVFGSELNQVWTNLIDNAIDAMPAEGGRLQVSTKREPVDVLIEIRDNGAGIPPEARSRIFDPFFTTKPVGEGTGLGLDTSMRIVRKHHGHLRFESKPGATCFQVRLPLAETDRGAAPEARAQ